MNNNLIFAFLGGVIVGVGGTLLADYFMNKESYKEEELEEEEYVIGEYKEVEINPAARVVVPNKKPELQDVVDYGRYSELTKKYKTKDETPDEEIIEPKKSENIFDTAEETPKEDLEKLTKKDAIPPKFRNNKPKLPHDIEEISQEQFRVEAEDYEKKSCIYFVGDGVLADDENLEVMDVPTTVGQSILDKFEETYVQTLYVSNISTEIDYEIFLDEGTHADYMSFLDEDRGDELCHEEVS